MEGRVMILRVMKGLVMEGPRKMTIGRQAIRGVMMMTPTMAAKNINVNSDEDEDEEKKKRHKSHHHHKKHYDE
ncbi:Hypothetical predicted protein [Olea europaea subsp. europaea]|uniref:Uncharacterized protein n=1 Tax=Olea europaea subsp. europaea TaxID=158383 RepID=A0A8S0T2Y0_OLEEU|nr:Hypothetical predicted protein [Olea europaea subsp. europaea]